VSDVLRAEVDWAHDFAWRFVRAEIEDVLTATTDDAPVTASFRGFLAEIFAKPDPLLAAGDALVEVLAIAGEAVIRLAEETGLEPKATLDWLASTPWTDRRTEEAT
jgi:hypothetical protein